MGCLLWVPAGQVGRSVSLAATKFHKLTQGTKQQSLHYLGLHYPKYTHSGDLSVSSCDPMLNSVQVLHNSLMAGHEGKK